MKTVPLKSNKPGLRSIHSVHEYGQAETPNKSTLEQLNHSEIGDTRKNNISVTNENPYMGHATLDNIRGYFHSTKNQYGDIKSRMLRNKEQELIQDIKKHRQQRDKQRELRTMNNRIMGDLSLEYTDLKRKAVTKDLQVSLFNSIEYRLNH